MAVTGHGCCSPLICWVLLSFCNLMGVERGWPISTRCQGCIGPDSSLSITAAHVCTYTYTYLILHTSHPHTQARHTDIDMHTLWIHIFALSLSPQSLQCQCSAASVSGVDAVAVVDVAVTDINQWMVLDFSKFVPHSLPLADSGLLTVLEEMPGYIIWEDKSQHLAVSIYVHTYIHIHTHIHTHTYTCIYFFSRLCSFTLICLCGEHCCVVLYQVLSTYMFLLSSLKRKSNCFIMCLIIVWWSE